MQLFCFLTEMEKQYGTTGKYICNEPMYAYEAVWQVQSGHPVFSGGPAGNRGKSSVTDYGSLCGTPMHISELMLSISTVYWALDDLLNAGYIQKQPRWRANGAKSSNQYVFRI